MTTEIVNYSVEPSKRLAEHIEEALKDALPYRREDWIFISSMKRALDGGKGLTKYLEESAWRDLPLDIDVVFKSMFGVSRKEYAEAKLSKIDELDNNAKEIFAGDSQQYESFSNWLKPQRERFRKIGGITNDETI